MADMKVSMVLSLLDEASPKLRQFLAVLDGLQTMSKTTSDALKVLDESLGGIGATTGDAVAGLRMLTRTFSGVSRSTSTLTDRLGTLEDSLTAAVDKLATMADSLKFSAEGMTAMAAATTTVNTGMAAMGDEAEVATGKLQGMHGTMKGLVELWGAWKMGEGLKKSVEIASDYQQRLIQMRNMGVPVSEQKAMRGDARQWSTISGISKSSALEAANAAIAGAPGASPYQQMVRQQLMPTILRAAYTLRTTYHDPNTIHDIVRNILGIVETRGKIQNVSQARKAVETAFRVVAGTEGKIRMGDMETGYRNTGYGEALRYSTKGIFNLEALHEQFKASGKAGGAGGNTKAGTIATMIASMMVGGKMNKVEAMMLEQLGLLNPLDVRKIRGTSTVKVKANALPESAAGLRNPVEWLRHVFDPHVVALMNKEHGNLSPTAMKNVVLDWAAGFGKAAGGVNVGTGLITTMDNEQWTAIRQRAHMMAHAASVHQGYTRAQNTVHGQMGDLKAALETIGQQIGSILLPSLQKLAQWATDAGNALIRLNATFPIFKKIEAWAGALGALLLGIKGVEWLLGIQGAFKGVVLWGARAGAAVVAWGLKVTGLDVTLASAGEAFAALMTTIRTTLAVDLTELGTLAASFWVVAAAGIGYAIGKYILNPIIGWAAKLFHMHSLGGDLARWMHPLPQSHYAAAPTTLAGMIAHFNAHPLNTAVLRHQTNLNRRADAIAPSTLGYEGPVTAQGLAKAHALAVKHKAAHAGVSGLAHLQALAQMIHDQYLGITSPTAGKIAAIQAKYHGYRQQFLAHGMMPSWAQAGMVASHDIAALKYHQAMGHLGTMKAHLHNQITANAALVTTGSLTKMQAAQRTIALQKAAAPAMIQTADAAMKYAKALGDPKLVSALQAQVAQLKAMGNQLTYYGARVHQVTQGAFSGLINQMMHGQKTWGQMIVGFFQSIANGIDKTISNAIAQSIANGLVKGKKNGQMGGLIGSAMSWLSGIGGGSSSGTPSPGGSTAAGTMHAAGKVASALGTAMKSKSGGSSASSGGFWGEVASLAGTILSSFAVGTTSVPHDMVAQIHKGEMIIPAGPAGQIRAGGGAQSPTVHMHINTIDSQSFLGHMSKVKREVAQMVSSTNNAYNLKHA
jgi:hypothetical protein